MAVQIKITAEEFLQLPESLTPTELIDGEIIVAPAPRASHQNTVYATAKVVEQSAASGKVYLAPIDVYLDGVNVVQPDVMWIAEESPCVLVDDAFFQGAPELIVEVLSPSTALRDKRTKFRLYERTGVREYWMIDPAAQYVEVWQSAGDKFVLLGVFGADETFTSAALGQKEVAVAPVFSA